jgi:hypothetical protein
MDVEKPKEIVGEVVHEVEHIVEEVVHEVEHVVEEVVHEVEHVVEEVERGEDERTPLFLGLGLMVVLGILAAILMAIAFLVYALAR